MHDRKSDGQKKSSGPSRKREWRLRSTGEAVTALFAHLGGEGQERLVQLWRHWGMVMGDELAGLGTPLGHDDRVLHIGAEDSMALQELSLQSGEILERVNAFMGEDFFLRIKVLLMQGRADLARKRPAGAGPSPEQPVFQEPAPEIGALLDKLRPDSPAARCYAAYVQARQKKGGGRK